MDFHGPLAIDVRQVSGFNLDASSLLVNTSGSWNIADQLPISHSFRATHSRAINYVV